MKPPPPIVFEFKGDSVAVVVSPDGKTTDVKPANGQQFTLEEMRGHIGGGYCEKMDLGVAVMMVDEDARTKCLEPNGFATRLAFAAGKLRPGLHILGTVLVMKRSLLK